MSSLNIQCVAIVASIAFASATVSMPQIFADGMVLQCHATYDQRPFVYGHADVAEIVNVNRTLPGQTPEVGGSYPFVDGQRLYARASPAASILLLMLLQPYFATADETGFWIVELDPDYFDPSNNGLIVVSVAGSSDEFKAVTVIRNVSYGDVFFCSGQVRDPHVHPQTRVQNKCDPIPS